jgi:hypothetical protein
MLRRRLLCLHVELDFIFYLIIIAIEKLNMNGEVFSWVFFSWLYNIYLVSEDMCVYPRRAIEI